MLLLHTLHKKRSMEIEKFLALLLCLSWNLRVLLRRQHHLPKIFYVHRILYLLQARMPKDFYSLV